MSTGVRILDLGSSGEGIRVINKKLGSCRNLIFQFDNLLAWPRGKEAHAGKLGVAGYIGPEVARCRIWGSVVVSSRLKAFKWSAIPLPC